MTCNQCPHFEISECAATNIPARILSICNHPDSGRLLIRIRKKITVCPVNDLDVRRELFRMIGYLGDENGDWVRYDTKALWSDAWQRLADRIENEEITRPDWCFETGKGLF